MAQVDIYTTDYCPYCVKAKALFDRKGVAYTEIDVTKDQEGRIALVEKSGGLKTVPQIFIDGKHMGGSDDVYALDKEGKLDALLNG